MKQLTPGHYRAKPLNWSVEKRDSGAVLVAIEWSASEVWNDSNWHALGSPCTVISWTAIVKRDGTPNDMGLTQLGDCGVWNGDFGEFEGPPPPATVAMLRIEEEVYKGVARMKVQWISPDADLPTTSGLRSNTQNELEAMNAEFGDLLRGAMQRASNE